MKTRIVIIVGLGFLWLLSQTKQQEPTPAPRPAGELNLTGAFVGETAADDAAVVAAMCGEIADCIEWDSMTAEPVLNTAAAIDQLRRRTREFRCRGRCLGEQHPDLARRVGEYLDAKLGVAGGPVTPEQKATWIKCYREIERAAADALP